MDRDKDREHKGVSYISLMGKNCPACNLPLHLPPPLSCTNRDHRQTTLPPVLWSPSAEKKENALHVDSTIDDIIREFVTRPTVEEVRLVGNKVLHRGKYVGFVDKGVYITERSSKSYFRKHHGFGISKGIVNTLKLPVLIVYTSEDGEQIPFKYSHEQVASSEVVTGKDSKGNADAQYILNAKIPDKSRSTMDLEEVFRSRKNLHPS